MNTRVKAGLLIVLVVLSTPSILEAARTCVSRCETSPSWTRSVGSASDRRSVGQALDASENMRRENIELREKLAETRTKLSLAQEKLAQERESQAAKLEEENKNLVTQLAALDIRNKEIAGRLDVAEKDKILLSSYLSAVISNVGTVPAMAQGAFFGREELATLQAENQVLKNQVAGISAQKATADTRVAILEKERIDLNQRLAALGAEKNSLIDQLAAFATNLNSANATLKTLTDQSSQAQARVQALESQNQSLRAQAAAKGCVVSNLPQTDSEAKKTTNQTDFKTDRLIRPTLGAEVLSMLYSNG